MNLKQLYLYDNSVILITRVYFYGTNQWCQSIKTFSVNDKNAIKVYHKFEILVFMCGAVIKKWMTNWWEESTSCNGTPNQWQMH